MMISPINGCHLKLLQNEPRKIHFPKPLPKGFYDACSNMSFDLSGRIYLNNRYKSHLVVPKHRFLDDNTVEFFVE